MATQNKIATIIDAITGETLVLDLIGDDLLAIEAEQNRIKSEFEAAKIKQKTDEETKAAIAERLGLTQDELALLLA